MLSHSSSLNLLLLLLYEGIKGLAVDYVDTAALAVCRVSLLVCYSCRAQKLSSHWSPWPLWGGGFPRVVSSDRPEQILQELSAVGFSQGKKKRCQTSPQDEGLDVSRPLFSRPHPSSSKRHAGACLPDAGTILREGNVIKSLCVYAVGLAADSFGVENAARWPPVAFSCTQLPLALHLVADKDTT